jgi:diaminopimelate epimerase
MKNEKYSFVKMSGAGNDFIVMDKKLNPSLKLTPEIVRKLCDRRNGIGADGVITINDSVKLDFQMEYFNADGSSGALCGNGARCAIKYAEISGRIRNGNTKFSSNEVLYSGKILDSNKVLLKLNEPVDERLNFTIEAANQLLKVSYIDTGAPHVIIEISDLLNPAVYKPYSSLDEIPVEVIGREIRYLKEFSPKGTNVNFIKIADNKIYIRTYERGVEAETLACGTGSVAAAVISFRKGKLKPPVSLITRGKDELIVDFNYKNLSNLSLIGPVRLTFTGEIPIYT